MTKLFVGQVPAICSEDQLSAIFGQFGEIADISIMRDKISGRSKGSAWVTFVEASAAEDAINTLHDKHSIPPQSNSLQIKYAGSNNNKSAPQGRSQQQQQQQQQQPPQMPPVGQSPMQQQPPVPAHPHAHLMRAAAAKSASNSSPQSSGKDPMKWNAAPCDGDTGLNGFHVPTGLASPWSPPRQPHDSKPSGQPLSMMPGASHPGDQHPLFAGFPGHHGVPLQHQPPPQPQELQQPLEDDDAKGRKERANRYPSRGGRKLFVGQLPKHMTADEVRELMSPYGTIEELHVMQDRKTGQGTGAAFVIFSTRGEAQMAINELNGKYTVPGMKCTMQVRFAEGEVDRSKDAKLFVGQVPYTASEDDLRMLFQPFGVLSEVALVRKAGQSKGCGFVRFTERKSADAAIQMLNGKHTMAGGHSPLTVRFADSEQEKRKRREDRQSNTVQQHVQQLQQNQLSAMMSQLSLGQGLPSQPFMQMMASQPGVGNAMGVLMNGMYPGMAQIPCPTQE